MGSEERLAGSPDITWALPFRGRALGGLWCLPRPRPPAFHRPPRRHRTAVCARAHASICLLRFQFRKIWKMGFALPWISRGDPQPHTRVQPSTGCGTASVPPSSQGAGRGNEPEAIPAPLHTSEQTHFHTKTPPPPAAGLSGERAQISPLAGTSGPQAPSQDPWTLQTQRGERQQFCLMTFRARGGNDPRGAP